MRKFVSTLSRKVSSSESFKSKLSSKFPRSFRRKVKVS